MTKSPGYGSGCLLINTDLQTSDLGQKKHGGGGCHCFLSALLLPPSQRTTFFPISKREMSRPRSAPKPALPQHLPKFYMGIPKGSCAHPGALRPSQTALSGETAVGRKVLSVPRVLRLGEGPLPWLSLTGADSGRVLGARIPLH